MDEKTIKSLLAEAQKNYRAAKKEFNKYDNHEDMHEMEQWRAAIWWLESKLSR